MTRLQINLGCLGLCVLLALGLLFAKFLVPIVPLLLAILLLFTKSQLKATIFSKQKKVYELTEGPARLAGKAILREQGLISPFFKESCIGYLYVKEEYIPNDDGYSTNTLAEQTACKNFHLETDYGSIHVNATGLTLKDLAITVKNEHSLKRNVNDLAYIEYLLKNKDEIVLVGTVIKNEKGQLEFAKVGRDLFFATTKKKVQEVKMGFDVLAKLSPWLLLMYLAVNYFLFFAPFISIPGSTIFPYFAIFGLPIIFVVLAFATKDKEGFICKILQFFAGVCFFTSFLNFPLIILFYSIKLEFYRIFCIFLSIAVFTTLALAFNYNHLTEFNSSTGRYKKHG
ncbi:hypothetical protein EZJ43_13325 [Pedobacter changchengzhani]|uniref:Uncharacterized protein n=1 Tax=Pedobacter changchengzhani TaxID=2529274 RepID=A0A4R5MJM4_9SPHI|nr:hypothetical protein [Pedobacter changchengzhani]TDG35596.1 hypothetical protein EZJ43_13325 [Pedobacter changchengzhani]